MSPFARRSLFAALAIVAVCAASEASAQVVYYQAYRPVVAAAPVVPAPVVAAPAYVANYLPAGNYAAVTAFSPPVYAAPAEVAIRTAYAPIAPAPVAVTSYYAPAPAYAATTAYYAPPVAAPVAVAPVIAAPVTAYYAPAVVAPVYRRGLFGAYRPVRTAYYIPY
jgi:hypothetical protein